MLLIRSVLVLQILVAGRGFWELPLGMLAFADRSSTPRQEEKESRPALSNCGVSRSDPSNQANPIHPDETLNSVAGPSGYSQKFPTRKVDL